MDDPRLDLAPLVDELTGRGLAVKGKSACCPWHEDTNPSASLLHGEDDRIWRIYCHRCDRRAHVLDLRAEASGRPVGELLRELPRDARSMPARATAEPERPAKIFPDLDAIRTHYGDRLLDLFTYDNNGQVELIVARLQGEGTKSNGKPRKDYHQFKPAPGGFTFGKPAGMLPLFSRAAIQAGADPVLVVEGEPCVKALQSVGIVATTSPGGAGKAAPADWTPLRGRSVVLWPDADPPDTKTGKRTGLDHMAEVARILAGLDCTVSMIDPDALKLPPGGDVVDLFDQLDSKTHEELAAVVRGIMAGAKPADGKLKITATPFQWIDPAQLPPRRWLYGKRLVRAFLSLIGAAGGVGKSGHQTVDAIAMVVNRNLIGEEVHGGPLRVWYWNLEDPQDEINRRFMAACQHYGISAADIGGRLFTDSGRDSPLCIATTSRDGTIIQSPVVDALVAELQARQIDVLMVDPYVSSHAVPENDNPAQDAVAKQWAKVANRANCSIYLAHHIRKMGGAEVTVESLRGGKALTDAARSVLILNPMTEEESEKAGLETNRGYFRSYDDKCNLAPAAERASWFRMQGVQLANGDNVGVVVPWQWPDAFDGVTAADLEAVKGHLAGKAYRESPQAAEWVGYEVAKVLHLDPAGRKADKAKLIRVIRTWVSNGALAVIEMPDCKRMMRSYVVVAGDDCHTRTGVAGQGEATAALSLPHHHPRKGCGGGAGQGSEAATPGCSRGQKLTQPPTPDEDAFLAAEETA